MMAYTYLIGWSEINKWYYGVRFAKNCDPSDLWVTYFTSSKRVKFFREKFGEPNVREIRKVFLTAEAAVSWEKKVLRRTKAFHSDKWLNVFYGEQYINKGGYRLSEAQKIKRRGKTPWNLGIPMAPHVSKIVHVKGRQPWNKGRPLPETLKKQHSIRMSGKNNPMYGKSATKNRHWYTNGYENVFVFEDSVPMGFMRGRVLKGSIDV